MFLAYYRTFGTNKDNNDMFFTAWHISS